MVTHPCVQLTFIEQSFPVALLRVYQKRYEQTKPATKFMKKKKTSCLSFHVKFPMNKIKDLLNQWKNLNI